MKNIFIQIKNYILCLSSCYTTPVNYPKVVHPDGDLDIEARELREVKSMIRAERGHKKKGPLRDKIDSAIVTGLIVGSHAGFLILMDYVFNVLVYKGKMCLSLW
jgi:hypothetical protein